MTKQQAQQGMSVREAAHFLGISEKALRRQIDRRVLPFRKVGRSIRFWRSELEAWRTKLPGCERFVDPALFS